MFTPYWQENPSCSLFTTKAMKPKPLTAFITCVAASTFIITFGLFCFTVRTFPGGGIRIEGPWGVRVEAQLGTSPIPEKILPVKDRK